MNIDRLMHSSLSALAGRGAQEACKFLERAHLAPWSTASNGRPPGEIERAAMGVRIAGSDHSLLGKRFFPGPLGGTAELLESGCPEAVRSLLAAAKKLRAGSFDLLGYRGLSFGSPIDWHLDPVSGVCSPRVHWSRIQPLDTAQVGDSKVVWELSRCQWWVALARAYAVTREGELAALIAGHARSWRTENPPGSGINWSSSLEVSLRLIAWCWTAFLLRGEQALSSSDMQALLLGIREHARHVSRYLSHHFSPNTHLTGEALGLFYAGCALPELEEAEAFRNLGARILIEQLRAQVLPDGIYFEQATCYQRYTVEIYLHFLILAASSGFEVPAEVSAQVVRMLDFLLAVRRPDGSIAPIGDADGGFILPLAERGPGDLRGIFSTAAAWFCRADYAWAAGGLQPETLWLLGQEGHDAFCALAPAPPDRRASRLFSQGGYAVMGSDWSANAHQLIFDVGPLGCPVSGGHGHADLLSIQCSIFGEPVIVDPGTGEYTGPWRDHFRSSGAHSTLTVDGKEQAITTGPFSWKQRPRAHLRHWISGAQLDLADASHEAYLRLSDPVRHRRRVLFVEQRFWVVVDDLEGAAAHRIALQFQLAPMKTIRGGEKGSEWVRALTPNGHALFMQSFANLPLELSIHEGETEPRRGWISPDYGQRVPAPMVVYAANAPLPMRIATLLFPLENASDPAPQAIAQMSPAGPIGLQFAEGKLVHFGSAVPELSNL